MASNNDNWKKKFYVSYTENSMNCKFSAIAQLVHVNNGYKNLTLYWYDFLANFTFLFNVNLKGPGSPKFLLKIVYYNRK